MPDTIVVTRWERDDPPDEGELYVLMEQAGYSPSLRGEPAGTRRQVQRHPYREMCWVVSGWVRYNFPSVTDEGQVKDVILKAGDRIEIPADLPYSTLVEGSSYAVYLFSTPWSLPVGPVPPNVNI